MAVTEKKYLALLLAIPFTASVYYALQMPVSYDEAWTFLNFTRKGFAESATHYPAPNNHILHSLITNATYYLPRLSNLMKLRISVLCINLASLLLLFRFVKRHFDFKLAMVVVAISSVLFLNLYYSYMSRGYSLVALFFILALQASFDIVKLENNRKHWIIFGIVSVLGFYAMPSFLYPFVTLNVFILYFRRKIIWPQIITGFLVVLAVSLLYLPIILKEGIAAITSNPYVKPIGLLHTIKSLPGYYLQTMAEITGIHWIFVVVVLGFSVFQVVRSKDQLSIVFCLVMIAAPIVLLTVHRVLPFARVFNYYGLVLVVLAALPYRKWFEKIDFKILITILIGVQVFFAFNFNRKIYAYENKDLAINITAHEIIPRIEGNHTYLFNFSLLAANLEFELISKGYKKYHVKTGHYPGMNADTVLGYDFIIINTDFDQTQNTQPFLTTPYYNIYKKNQEGH